MDHIDLMFWVAVAAIVLLGTIGSIIYKYGTNEIGAISFEKLFDIKMSGRFWLYGALMVAGFLLFVFGGMNLRSESFAMNYLFSPVIFTALVLMFLSRFLVGIPLSTTDLGRYTVITTSLGVIATTVASFLVFKEEITTRLLLGIVLGIVAVFLLSGSGS